MEIRTIATFVRIAELKSFSRAARQLGYSQSAVTMQMKQLEEEGRRTASPQGAGASGGCQSFAGDDPAPIGSYRKTAGGYGGIPFNQCPASGFDGVWETLPKSGGQYLYWADSGAVSDAETE